MSGQQSSYRSTESSQRRRTNEGLPPLRVGGPMMSSPELTSTTQIPVAPTTTPSYYHMVTPIWAPSPLRLDGSSSSGTHLLSHPQLVYNRPPTSASGFVPPHPPRQPEQPSDSAVAASISPYLSQPDDDDDDGGEDLPPTDDPGVKGGRGITTPGIIPQDDPARRIPLALHDYGGFTSGKANTVIGYLIRLNFDPKYLRWDALPSEHKEKLWNQFGRYFRWEKEEEHEIFKEFDKIGHMKFIKALNQAKGVYEKEGKRVKWLKEDLFNELRKHWKKDDVMIISARAAKNRGVQINEEGKKVPAKPTYFGAQLEDRPCSGQSIESYVYTHVRKIPNMDKDELYTGRNDLQWPKEKDKEQYERYMLAITEKYRDNPSAKPRPLDPMDASVWEKVVGGAKRGRLPGVSAELRPEAMGFSSKKRHVLSFVSPHQVEEIHNLKTEVVELKDQIKTMKNEVEQTVMQKVLEMLRGRMSEERAYSSRASDTVEQHEDVYIPAAPEQNQGVNGFENLDEFGLNDDRV